MHIGEADGKNHCGLWQIRDMMLDKDSPADRAEMRGGEAMQTAELAALDWIQAHLRCGFLDAVLPVISWTCDHGEIWIALAVILLLLKRQRWTGVSVSLGLILDLICCNLLLKPLVDRVRPFAVNTAVELLAAPPGDASFPSGHTAASFAAVGPHGGVLRGGVRPAGGRQSPVEAGPGPGLPHRLLPALSLYALAHRRAGRHPPGSRCRNGGRLDGETAAEETRIR